jgi:curli biogenesis system outer membrane secretion channel CsgG
MNKRFTVLVISLVSSLLLIGCGAVTETMEKKTEPQAKVDTTLTDELGPYSGPKARLAVADFQWKVQTTGRRISITGVPGSEGITISEEEQYMTGLEDMLTTALFQTNRFRVVERQALGAVLKEQELGQAGVVSKETAAKTGAVKGADILVVAAVTGWEPGTSGTSAGGGGGVLGKAKGVIGAIRGGVQKSSMAMDIRIIDSSTSEVLSATRVEGVAKDVNFGVLAGGFMSAAGLGGGLSTFSKTPMEKAIRTCIYESVKFLVKGTPEEYFKH